MMGNCADRPTDLCRSLSLSLCVCVLNRYIFLFLLENHGSNMDAIAEEGYNLFLSCHCYADDGEVLMFKKVLYGEISEECHFDFECLMAALMQEVSSRAQREDDQATTIPREDLFAVIDTFFPGMEAEAKAKIKDALVREAGQGQGKEAVDFMRLFDMEDRSEENQAIFLGEIMLQYLRDLSAYSSDLKAELMKVKADENGFAKLSDIKGVIVAFDAMKTEDDVHMYLTRGAHLNSVADAKWYMELGEEVEISEFVRNLTNKLVRASKYYFMSSMAPGFGDNGDDEVGGGAGGTFLTEPTLA